MSSLLGEILSPQVKIEQLNLNTAASNSIRKSGRVRKTPRQFAVGILNHKKRENLPKLKNVKLRKCFLCGQLADISQTDDKIGLSLKNMNTVCSLLGLETSNECFEAFFMLSKRCASCTKLFREIYDTFQAMYTLKNTIEEKVGKIFQYLNDRLILIGGNKCKIVKSVRNMEASELKNALGKGEISDKQKIQMVFKSKHYFCMFIALKR